MDYYKILNVQRDCSVADLRKAFRKLSMEAHPDKFQGEDRIKAEREYQFIVKAFNTLKDPSQRKKYDKSLEDEVSAGSAQVLESRKKEAAQYEKVGVGYYKKGQFIEAVEFLNKAAFLAPNASIFYFKGLAEKEVLGRKKDALISFQKAIDADAYQVKFRIALIEALLGMGLKTRAQKTLEEALGIFPGDQELQNLRSSYFPEDEPSKGLKSIFSVFRGKK